MKQKHKDIAKWIMEVIAWSLIFLSIADLYTNWKAGNIGLTWQLDALLIGIGIIIYILSTRLKK